MGFQAERKKYMQHTYWPGAIQPVKIIIGLLGVCLEGFFGKKYSIYRQLQ
jgi:hypothetical protein